MGVIEDMGKFMQMKAAMATEKAAETQSQAGEGVGLGLAMMLPSLFGMKQTEGAASRPSEPLRADCPACGNSIPGDSSFCPKCGHQLLQLIRCSNCGKNLTPQAKFCSQCGQPASQRPAPKICSQCGTENLFNSIFCNECGQRLG
jgi:predicted amidophosphoribosyltransferase